MIRLNEKNTIALSKLPLLCYILYIMIANSYIKNNLYFHYIKDDKYQKIMSIRTIIETFVDLINSIVNTYYNKDDMKKMKKIFYV